MSKLEDLKLHQQWRLGEIQDNPLTRGQLTDSINFAISTLEEANKEQLEFNRQAALALISNSEFINRIHDKRVISTALTEEIERALDKLNKIEHLKGVSDEKED